VKIHDDLSNRLKNAKRRERRRRMRDQAGASKPSPLDLREIAPDRPLRLYDRPVALPDPGQPAVCPTCGRELVCFDHRGQAMLMCEPCCRLWPTSQSSTTYLRVAVRHIVPLAEIELRRKGNEQDYNRVYYAKNRERLRAQQREWLETCPEQGKRYRRAYYQANREKILKRQLANYHANKTEKQAKQSDYRKKNRDKERERQRRWKAQNPEKHLAQRRAYEAAHRERINAQKRARRAADPEKYRAYKRDYYRRRSAGRNGGGESRREEGQEIEG
jgi:hypothetical protein